MSFAVRSVARPCAAAPAHSSPTAVPSRAAAARIELQEVNDVVKRAVPYQSPASQDVAALKTKLLAQLRPVDEFAYKQQKEEFMPSILKDYCAPGVVPRDEPGACKLRPVLDKVPAQARLKDAVATLDAIIKALS